MKILRSVYAFVIFTVLLAALPLCIMYTGHANLFIPQFWGMFAFISIITFFAVFSVLIGQRYNAENYAQYFLAATVVKMLLCLSVMLLFILKFPVNKAIFMGNFIYLYFLNMGFEVYVLLCNLRNQNLK